VREDEREPIQGRCAWQQGAANHLSHAAKGRSGPTVSDPNKLAWCIATRFCDFCIACLFVVVMLHVRSCLQ
jgi:hypothetical protein